MKGAAIETTFLTQDYGACHPGNPQVEASETIPKTLPDCQPSVTESFGDVDPDGNIDIAITAVVTEEPMSIPDVDIDEDSPSDLPPQSDRRRAARERTAPVVTRINTRHGAVSAESNAGNPSMNGKFSAYSHSRGYLTASIQILPVTSKYRLLLIYQG